MHDYCASFVKLYAGHGQYTDIPHDHGFPGSLLQLSMGAASAGGLTSVLELWNIVIVGFYMPKIIQLGTGACQYLMPLTSDCHHVFETAWPLDESKSDHPLQTQSSDTLSPPSSAGSAGAVLGAVRVIFLE